MPDGRSFSFLHAADLHLDAPVRGLGSQAPEMAALVRDASLDALDSLVEVAIERRCAFVVLAGDLYDGPERGLRAQLRLRDGLQRLSDAGIASFLVHGNHDPLETGWSAIDRWPQRCHVFGSGELEVLPVMVDGALVATVQGLSYARRATTENLARRMRRPEGAAGGAAGRGAGPVHIGVLHCNVAGSPGGHENYSPCTLDDLRATRLDYLALGHVHERAVLSEGTGPGDPWVVYPGNTQAHSFRASERGAKGAYLVHVGDGRVGGLEFVPCDQLRFCHLEVPAAALSTLAEVSDELLARIGEMARSAGGRPLLVRAELTGTAALHGELARPQVLDELLAHLRDESRTLRPLCYVDRLIDSTRRPGSEGVLEGRPDFAGELVTLGRSLVADTAGGADFAARALAGLPRGLATRVAEVTADPDRLAAAFERAMQLALDELSSEHR